MPMVPDWLVMRLRALELNSNPISSAIPWIRFRVDSATTNNDY